MVCRKCGSDLKPGIKYCLNCGEYLTQEELDILETGEAYNNEEKLEFSEKDDIDFNEDDKKDGKLSKKAKDIIVYSILFAVLIGSIIVMVFFSSEEVVTKEQPPVTYEDRVVKMSNYQITFSGKLKYKVSGAVVYIEDDNNYFIAYQVASEKYESYTDEFLRATLTNGGNKVVSNEVRVVKNTNFILYTFQDQQNIIRYMYVCKIDDNHVAIGNITEKQNGNLESALLTITEINGSIEYLS